MEEKEGREEKEVEGEAEVRMEGGRKLVLVHNPSNPCQEGIEMQ